MKKVILLTGASSGIGYNTAESLAKEGHIVYGAARRIERMEDLKQFGVKPIYLDVTNEDSIKNAVNMIIENEGRIDVLINNAGLALGLEKFQDYNIADIERMIDTNIKGLLYVTREVIPNMVENNDGHIINIGSTAGIYSYGGAAVYCATKSAVKFLSDGIRIDTIDKNIKVSTLQPGIVETDFSEVRFHGDKERAKKVYEGVEALKPEDIADVALYVANQPKHVQISDITIMATKQATGFNVHREK